MRWRIVLKVKGKYFTKYDFGTWDEIANKYSGKYLELVQCNDQ